MKARSAARGVYLFDVKGAEDISGKPKFLFRLCSIRKGNAKNTLSQQIKLPINSIFYSTCKQIARGCVTIGITIVLYLGISG